MQLSSGGEDEEGGGGGECVMYVCVCVYVCVSERERERDSTNYVCVSGAQPFFSPPTRYLIKGCNHKASRCSTHITSLPGSFPHSSPPLLSSPILSSLMCSPSVEETPTGQIEALQQRVEKKKKEALRSPPLLVRCHTTRCPRLSSPLHPFQIVIAPPGVTLPG